LNATDAWGLKVGLEDLPGVRREGIAGFCLRFVWLWGIFDKSTSSYDRLYAWRIYI
jgi:hypothetical protein